MHSINVSLDASCTPLVSLCMLSSLIVRPSIPACSQRPFGARLLKASSWLPFHPVNLVCGEKRAQLVGGKNADTNEICVLCSCDACTAR